MAGWAGRQAAGALLCGAPLLLLALDCSTLSVELAERNGFYGVRVDRASWASGDGCRLRAWEFVDPKSQELVTLAAELRHALSLTHLTAAHLAGLMTNELPAIDVPFADRSAELAVCDKTGNGTSCLVPATQYSFNVVCDAAAAPSEPRVLLAPPPPDLAVRNLTARVTASGTLAIAWTQPPESASVPIEALSFEVIIRSGFPGNAPYAQDYRVHRELLTTLMFRRPVGTTTSATFSEADCVNARDANQTAFLGFETCLSPNTFYDVAVVTTSPYADQAVYTGLTTQQEKLPTTIQDMREFVSYSDRINFIGDMTGPHSSRLTELDIRYTSQYGDTGIRRTSLAASTLLTLAAVDKPDLRDGRVVSVVFGLQPYTGYNISARYIGEGGRVSDTWSEPVFLSTVPTVPSPFLSPTVQRTEGEQFVEVHWALPVRPTSPLDLIQISLLDDGVEAMITDVPGNATRAFVPIAANRSCCVAVRGVWQGKLGPWSPAVRIPNGTQVLTPDSRSGAPVEEIPGLLFGLLSLAVLLLIALAVVAVWWRKRARRADDAVLIPIDDWHIPTSKVTVRELIGQGAFSQVHRGEWAEGSFGAATQVAVKACKGEGPEAERAFHHEMEIMKSIARPGHPNVLALLGVCYRSKPVLLILEHMANGDLKRYLKASAKQGKRPSNHALIGACLDVACGMRYLAEVQGFVHGDLAARNCLVSETPDGNLIVKLADFGFSQDVHYLNYYRRALQAAQPVRWMAPESLLEGIVDSATDMFACGIVCWEVFSGAQTPYGCLRVQRVPREILHGARPAQPPGCPDAMYDVMGRCWQLHERPSFSDLRAWLLEIRDLPGPLASSAPANRRGIVYHRELVSDTRRFLSLGASQRARLLLGDSDDEEGESGDEAQAENYVVVSPQQLVQHPGEADPGDDESGCEDGDSGDSGDDGDGGEDDEWAAGYLRIARPVDQDIVPLPQLHLPPDAELLNAVSSV